MAKCTLDGRSVGVGGGLLSNLAGVVARPVVAVIVLAAPLLGCTTAADQTSPTNPAAATTVASTTTPATTSTTRATTTTASATATTAITATTSVDPPYLEIVDPVRGATVTTSRYTFKGLTDPNCTVAVGGKYEATVEPDGSWALDLLLAPGRISTTFVASDPDSGLETSVAVRVYYADALELRADGLGAVPFGQDEETTMAILTGLLGPPTGGGFCNDPGVVTGECTGAGYGWCEYVRNVHWKMDGLSIVIASCDDEYGDWHAPVLIAWHAGYDSQLQTPEGVGIGVTLGELDAIYDVGVAVVPGCGEALGIEINASDGHGSSRIRVGVPHVDNAAGDKSSEDPWETFFDPSAIVKSFAAGASQSC